MKIKNIIISLLAIATTTACSNSDWEYDDYDVQACYFPYQTPARTLILGEYGEGINENDNNYIFEITSIMTGVYDNEEVRKVYFEIDNTLLDNVSNVQALPAEYYTLETVSPAIIPVGSTKAVIQVQLTDAFFNDTLSFGDVQTTNYVVPVRLTDVENLDSLFTGSPLSGYADPDPVNPNHWDVTPKDYTLFGIKFMNKYQGTYLRRGLDKITSGTAYVGREYHADYVVQDELIDIMTCGNKKVRLENIIGRGDDSSPGNVALELSFSDDETCTIASYKDDAYNVSGTGRFVVDGDEWGGEPRDVIYLEYTYTDEANAETHLVNDTIVIRDRGAVFEEFEVELIEE